MAFDRQSKPWETVAQILETDNRKALTQFLEGLGPMETARSISRLSEADQNRVFTLLTPQDAAGLIEDVPDEQAADLVEALDPVQAAAIIDELKSDDKADLLGEMSTKDAEAILQEMSTETAKEARQLMAYPADTAGGIMISEYLAFPEDKRVGDVLSNLQANREKYVDYHVQYLYVVDQAGRLVGVLRMHDLLFPDRSARLKAVMITDPLSLTVDTATEALREFFDEHKLFGVPVVDAGRRLVGVVLPEAVEEAALKQADRQFLDAQGIVGGEEFRTMPLRIRSRRRLSWLSINILLNVIAASVIALYQDTLAAVIALAVFLPIISDMSGCSGNQAVAVSMRELTLGLIQPKELFHVLRKEVALGLVNGLALGVLLGGVALLWKGNPFLGLVVGAALFLNTLLAVGLGGVLPLFLKRLKLDPALVSGPILTTLTDMCGFFLVLSLATFFLPRLT